MKYKRLHELSDAEYQVLQNIAARNLFDIMDVQIAYVGWSRGHEVNKAIEKEFEMAFLGDTKSMHRSDKPSYYVTKNDLSKGIQRAFETFNVDFARIIAKRTADNSKRLEATPKVLRKPKRDLIINADDILNLKIELNRADFSYDKFLERI